MSIVVRAFMPQDTEALRGVWNKVVEDGRAFPQLKGLSTEEAESFFAGQSYTGTAVEKETGEIVGLYILHPNNVGRCGHIANASYAVRTDMRGKHVGEALVGDCLAQAKRLGFRILQFNAVVASNLPARHLYQKMGFTELGKIPSGFLLPEGTYEDILIYYHQL
ncbi:MAG: GNAT family N-acetyltransferase [Lachnospiraceae bacterium]